MKKSKQKVSWPKWIFVYKKAHRRGYSRDQITQIAFCVLYIIEEIKLGIMPYLCRQKIMELF